MSETIKDTDLRVRVAERFWSKVDVKKEGQCWPWRGCVDSQGYGRFRVNGSSTPSHRVAFWLRNGEQAKLACHRCNNPICCNPDHIYSGTHQDNSDDAKRARLYASMRGERNYNARLSDEDVIGIRRHYRAGEFTLMQLAEKYECSYHVIQRAVKGRTFSHLNKETAEPTCP